MSQLLSSFQFFFFAKLMSIKLSTCTYIHIRSVVWLYVYLMYIHMYIHTRQQTHLKISNIQINCINLFRLFDFKCLLNTVTCMYNVFSFSLFFFLPTTTNSLWSSLQKRFLSMRPWVDLFRKQTKKKTWKILHNLIYYFLQINFRKFSS